MFECRIFYKSIYNCKQILTAKTIKSNTFKISKAGNLKCFCEDRKYGIGFYSLVYVKFGGKKYHPCRFKKLLSSMEEIA